MIRMVRESTQTKTREALMKLPIVKFYSGQVVSLAAFLLKMTSHGVGQARRTAITGNIPA
jgi:hypothetical protein